MINWQEKNLKNSSDVWFIAFLLDKNCSIVKYDVMDRGRVRCYFSLNDKEWQDYKLEFNNSEIIKFKAIIERIKDLAF
jgi:hypothetical protein